MSAARELAADRPAATIEQRAPLPPTDQDDRDRQDERG
jgi:hypothetical protein